MVFIMLVYILGGSKNNFIFSKKVEKPVSYTHLTSKRKEVKELIKTMKQVNPNVDQNIFKALDNVNLDCILGTKKDKVYHSFLEDYEK